MLQKMEEIKESGSRFEILGCDGELARLRKKLGRNKEF